MSDLYREIHLAKEEAENAKPYRSRGFHCWETNVFIDQCTRCGALVGHKAMHTEWHRRIGDPVVVSDE